MFCLCWKALSCFCNLSAIISWNRQALIKYYFAISDVTARDSNQARLCVLSTHKALWNKSRPPTKHTTYRWNLASRYSKLFTIRLHRYPKRRYFEGIPQQGDPHHDTKALNSVGSRLDWHAPFEYLSENRVQLTDRQFR